MSKTVIKVLAFVVVAWAMYRFGVHIGLKAGIGLGKNYLTGEYSS
jgi:hypothetical protein